MGRTNKQNDTISVVIPTCNRYRVLLENIRNIRGQELPVEIVICDDSHIKDHKENNDLVQEVIKEADQYHYTASYDHVGNKLYGLGRARNRGVIEANGSIIVFLDDRITPANEFMISMFRNKLIDLGNKYWLFGDKGAQKKSFVENCSAVRRMEIIISGMFSETINSYGYMTREVYARHIKQGFKFEYVPRAKARPLCTGTRRNNPERDKQITFSKGKLRKMRLI